MKFYQVFAILLLLVSISFADFTYVASFNGTNDGESNIYYLFSQPKGILYVDGRLYVTDSARSVLVVYNATTYQRIGGWIGEAKSSDAAFYNPSKMAYADGAVYIADESSASIKMYKISSSQVVNWNTGGVLSKPTGLVIGSDSIYIADAGKKQVFAYSRTTKSYTSVVIDSGGSDGKLSSPQDIKFYKGNYYVSDSDKGLVFVYDSNFTFLSTIGRGLGGVTLHSPHGIALANDRLFVTDTSANSVVEFTLDGYPVSILNSSVPGANLSYPEDIAVNGNTLYVADTFSKLVKVFTIDETSGNNTVQQQLASANYSIKSLSQVKAAALKLNVTIDSDTFDSDLMQAQSDYAHFVYSSASAIAQKIIDNAPISQANLSQRVEIAAKQLAKAAIDRVAPYRAQAKGNAAALVAQFDAKTTDMNAKLAGKFYVQAADIALSLSASADGIIDATVGNAAKEEQARKDRLAAEIQAQIGIADSKIKALDEKAITYRQSVNTSTYSALLENARKALLLEDFTSANKSALSIIADVSSQDDYISQISKGIDAALTNISIAELDFNSSAAKPMLVPADFASERKQFADARNLAYSNPAFATAMASQAAQSASVKVKDAQSLSVAVAAVLVMSGLIVLIGIVFLLHLRNRKRRGLENADAGAKHQADGKQKR